MELKQLNQENHEVRWKLQHVPDSSMLETTWTMDRIVALGVALNNTMINNEKEKKETCRMHNE